MGRPRATTLLTLLSLASGGLLVLSVMAHLHLGYAMLCLIVMMGSLLGKLAVRLPPASRGPFARAIGKMLFVGLCATLTYDLSRLLIVTVFDIRLNPFAAFPHFGSLLLGAEEPQSYRLIVGTLYHFWNGCFFGLAYLLMAASRRFYWGVVFAFGLEILMLAVYPTWLKLADVLGEFTVMSMSGHLCYGLVLGIWGERLPRWRVPVPRNQV